MGTDGGRIDELRGITKADGSVVKNPRELIEKGLEKACPTITREEKEIAARKLEQHADGKIKIGDKEIEIGQLEFLVANSIQTIESTTSPKNEYFKWIDEGSQIIFDMTHDGVTPQELDHRREFLNDLDQREVEMKTCISLYRQTAQGTGHLADAAREKLEFLQTKWAKLMEIRSAIKTSTQNFADPQKKVNEEDYYKAQIYLWALKMMRSGREIPYRIKSKLEMNYGITFDYSVSENLIQKINKEPLTKKQAIDRINALRGRKSVLENDEVPVHKQRFNSNTFALLREQELRQRA